MIVADTDVMIDAKNGVEPARTRLADALAKGELATTAITAFELECGARTPADRDDLDALLDAMLLLPIDGAVSRVAGALARTLSTRGSRIGFADTLIAGACLVHGAALWTRNRRHFSRVPGLELTPP